MRTCPNCTKPIEDDAVKCPYCGKMTDYNDDNDEVKKLIVQMENKSPKKILSRIGNKTEADIVREIAKQYLGGSSLKTIAGGLTLRTIEYMPGKSDWNKSRIRRMIDDTRYIGNNGYPPILTEQEYSAMQAFKSQKNTQKNIDHSDNIFKLNAPVVCANCGGRMQRRIDNRRKTITRWRCTECKTSVNISDEDMLGGITELLNEVIADPESIQIPKSDYEESQEIKRLNAEISKELNTVGFDKEAIKQKMLTCVSEKYMSLGTEEVTAQSLKDIFKDTPPLTAYDSDLTDQAVSGIQLKENGTISLVLINGQRIGKEKSA